MTINEILNDIIFHDSRITKFEKKGNNIIIDFDDDYNLNITSRIIFENGIIDDENIVGEIVSSVVVSDGLFELDLFDKKVNITFTSLEVEQFVTNELYEKYKVSSDEYNDNFNEVSEIIGNNISKYLNTTMSFSAITDYNYDKDLTLHFKHVLNGEEANIKFINSIVKIINMNHEITKEELDTLSEDLTSIGIKMRDALRQKLFYTRVKKLDNKFEVGILVRGDTEVVIICDGIELA